MLQILLFIVYFFLLSVIIYNNRFFSSRHLSKKLIITIWIIKVIAGFSVLWIYQYYYGGDRKSGDVFKYFDDAEILFRSFSSGHYLDFFSILTGWNISKHDLSLYFNNTDFWFKHFNYGLFNENRTIIRINLLIRIFSGGNIYIHSLFFSFLSFVGLWLIYKSTTSFFSSYDKKWLLIIIFLIPSVLFWGSSIMKETLVLSELGIYLYGLFLFEIKKYLKAIFFIIIGFTFLFFTKIYVALALIPGTLIFIWYSYHSHHIFRKIIIIHSILIGLFFLSTITPYNLPNILIRKQHDFLNMINFLSPAGSAFEMEYLKENKWSIITHLPKALFNSLCRPLPKDIHNITGLLSLGENFTFLLLFIFLFFFKRTHNSSFIAFEQLIWSFSFIMLIIIGLTTPVSGAIVRYRVPILPILGIVWLEYIDTKKIKKIIYNLFKD